MKTSDADDAGHKKQNPADDALPPPPLVQSEELLRGGNQIHILHAGEVYRLFRTRNNKLLLQK